MSKKAICEVRLREALRLMNSRSKAAWAVHSSCFLNPACSLAI